MKTIDFKGAYTKPECQEFSVKCERGFAQSTDLDGFTPIDGEWDE